MTNDYRKQHLVREVDRHRHRVIKLAQMIAEDMQLLAARLERENPHGVNELGELQGKGPQLDAACACYATAMEALRVYDLYVSRNDEEASKSGAS